MKTTRRSTFATTLLALCGAAFFFTPVPARAAEGAAVVLSPSVPKTPEEMVVLAQALAAPQPAPLAAAGPVGLAPATFTSGDVYAWTVTSPAIYNITAGGNFAAVPPLATTPGYTGQFGQIAWKGDRTVMYLSDYNAQVVLAVTPAGVVSVFATGLTHPAGLAWTPAGQLLVGESGTAGRVKDITAGGNFSAAPSFATGLPSYTRNMVVTPTGRVLICNETNGNVYDITAGGAITAANVVATVTGGTNYSMAVSAVGRVLLTNTAGLFDITAGGTQSVPTRGTGSTVGVTGGPGGKVLVSGAVAGGTVPVLDISAGGAVGTAPVFASGFPGGLVFTALATVPGPTQAAPTVVTLAATGFGVSTATINGTVDGHGDLTTYSFAYGVSPTPNVIVLPQPLGFGSGPQPVSTVLTGLALNTSYSFFAIGKNTGGEIFGATLTFSTPPLTLDANGRYHLPAGTTWTLPNDMIIPGDLVIEGTLVPGAFHLTVLGTATVAPGAAAFAGGSVRAFFRDGAASLGEVDTTMSGLETLATFGLVGQQPMSKLLDAGDGWLYGTTASGGKANDGVAFRMKRTGEAQVLGSFTGLDGIAPQSALVKDNEGGIFGTTTAGGTLGKGTVFRVLPAGGIVKVADFDGTNGRMPSGGLTLGTDGLLYGVASRGGTLDRGTLFRVTALGVIEKLADFTGPNGWMPQAALTLGSDGIFRGVTTYGGTANTGVIFSYDKVNGLVTLASLTGPVGAYPQGALLEDGPGVFYGTCYAGGANDLGTVFRFGAGGQPPPPVLGPVPELVASFTLPIGQGPIGPLARGTDGNFYGTAYTGVNGYGAIFKVTSGGALTRVTSVIGNAGTGAHPGGGLLLGTDGAWYGVSQDGGPSARGAVFRVLLTGVMENVVNFTDTLLPSGLTVGPVDGQLYGTTLRGGNVAYGSVFGFAPRTLPVTLASFAPGIGKEPQVGAGAVFGTDGTTLFGTAATGALGKGAVWKLPAGGALSALVSFNGVNGSGPLGGLVPSGDGGFFGTTAAGTGNAFKVTAAGVVTQQGTFTNGASPQVALAADGAGAFYGTTRAGGAGGLGTVYKMTPGSGVAVVASFAGANGAAPLAALLRVADAGAPALSGDSKEANGAVIQPFHFAGTTSAGGAGGLGSLFTVTPGGAVATLFSFAGAEGSLPRGALLGTGDGGFFGTASGGGAFGKGTVWRLGALGTMQVIAHLTGDIDGSAPSTGLTAAPDGYLYGSTDATIFRVPFAPSVTTLAATGFTPLQTTLRGEIQPRGLATTATFEWGTTPALGSTLAAGSSSSTSAVPVSATLPLVGGTTYYYRAIATNVMGVKKGSVLKFKTPPLVPGAGGFTLPAGTVWTLPGDYTFAGNLTILGTLDTAGQSLTVLGKLTLNALLLNATGVISYLDRDGNLPPGAIRLLGDAAHDALDLDGDTLGNLMEFALGTNPSVFSPGALPVPAVVGGFLTLTYHTPAGIGGVQVIVEVSNDLTNWFTGPGFTAVTSDTIANGVRTVAVRDDQGGALQYIRLRVTR